MTDKAMVVEFSPSPSVDYHWYNVPRMCLMLYDALLNEGAAVNRVERVLGGTRLNYSVTGNGNETCKGNE